MPFVARLRFFALVAVNTMLDHATALLAHGLVALRDQNTLAAIVESFHQPEAVDDIDRHCLGIKLCFRGEFARREIEPALRVEPQNGRLQPGDIP